MKQNYTLWSIAVLCLLCFSCYDDEGNYDYREPDQLEITDIQEEISVLAYAERIQITPKVISKQEGEIKADNPNYTFTYLYDEMITTAEDTRQCSVLDSSFTKDLDIPAELKARKYKCWFEVMDKRTGVVTTKPFFMTVASTNYEGWMVLCNEGDENRVRMDMIGMISPERNVVTHDILSNTGLPLTHNAVSISLDPNFGYASGAVLYMLSEDGGYKLDGETFDTGIEYSMNYEYGDAEATYSPLRMCKTSGFFVVTDKNGNAYAKSNVGGAIFESPINTMHLGGEPEFDISPYLCANRTNTWVNNALLYDVTNRRFVMWNGNFREYCSEIVRPEPALFDYNTGKELVYMESIASNSEAYALLKDTEGRFSLYGIQFVYGYPVSTFKQSMYEDGEGYGIHAQRLSEATCFAFHSNQPYLFYALGNEIWQFDYVNKSNRRMKILGDKEEITLLKFNVFTGNYANVTKPESYINMQYDLIVGSVDHDVKSVNNGILRFYSVPRLNADIELKGTPYNGFAKIADVVYRERK